MSDWDARVQSPRRIVSMAGLEHVGGGTPAGPVFGGELLPPSWRDVPLERLQRYQLMLSIAASVVVIAAGLVTISQKWR